VTIEQKNPQRLSDADSRGRRDAHTLRFSHKELLEDLDFAVPDCNLILGALHRRCSSPTRAS
jgi:hypothetical protein